MKIRKQMINSNLITYKFFCCSLIYLISIRYEIKLEVMFKTIFIFFYKGKMYLIIVSKIAEVCNLKTLKNVILLQISTLFSRS